MKRLTKAEIEAILKRLAYEKKNEREKILANNKNIQKSWD